MEEEIDALTEAIRYLQFAKEEIKGLYDDEVAEIEYLLETLEKELDVVNHKQGKIWEDEIRALNREYERGAL